jgi:drug/metabolite transporter (DMT)-like permease
MTGRFSPGLRWAAAGALSFSLMSALAKLSGERIPTQEIIFFRALITTVLTVFALRQRKISLLGTERWLLLLRGLFGFGALSCFLWAVVRLPLADTTVLHFTHPVFTALLAAMFLKETLRRQEVVLAFLAMAGVVTVARPGFLFGVVEGLNPVAVSVALVGAALSAAAYVTARRLTRTNDPLVIVLAFAVVALFGSLPATVSVFVLPQGWEWLQLLGVGLATQGGQVFVTRALKVEKAGRVMAVGYLQIVFAAFWGLLLFAEAPDLWTWVGALMIIGATLLMGRSWSRVTHPGR